ncbi:MAG: GH92 family glycosyl hydrolase [Bacteroidia bacterium]|nr:GH92 family glycosyl hydrolase [Bacteroidia bacterium]
MNRFFYISANFFLLLTAILSLSCNSGSKVSTPVSATELVDPFIGTADHGHTYPGATVPFGMVQLSPDNGTQGWDWCSGYNYVDSVIVGFSHTHLSGTGIGDLCDVLMMPTTRPVDFSKTITSRDDYDYRSAFLHEKEEASPGYYAVFLEDSKVKVELTATQRVGFHRYTFPESEASAIVIDLGFAINWDAPVDTKIEKVSEDRITGHRLSTGWAKDQRVYFAAQFSRPMADIQIVADTTTADNGTQRMKSATKISFPTQEGEQIMVKVGISSANPEGALKALDEVADWDFDAVREKARKAWEDELSVIKVESDNEQLKTIFYTALYHSQVAPVLFSDANGYYKGADDKVHKAENYTKYGIFSLWDTFRAENPLFTLTQPDRVNDMIQSLMSHYREYGLLPVWSLLGNETNTMTGYHAVPVIVDAYLKGYRGFDAEEAFEAMKKSAMQDIRATDFLRQYNYIPHDKAGQSVTRTLEYTYDDWCIAQMAKALGKLDDYDYFMKRAGNFRNVFDPSTGFMRARMADGSWKTPFDPKYSDHNESAEYTEGNAWQHTWFVPHDVHGMIELFGGNEVFVTKLDAMFTESSDISGENASADISGLIGQYAHGNEPSHHIAYLYNYAGAPWKTQAIVRQICETMYTDKPNGLCGNEDCGQMSAWYVFSAMGFYPLNPAQGIYVIGSPMFDRTEIRVNEGKSFVVTAENVSGVNKYIQSAKLNGQALDRSYITHEEVMKGGELAFIMGPQPNESWAVSAQSAPPSMSYDTRSKTRMASLN